METWRHTAAGPSTIRALRATGISCQFRGGLVFKAHRWWYHSTLGSRVITKKKKISCQGEHVQLQVANVIKSSNFHRSFFVGQAFQIKAFEQMVRIEQLLGSTLLEAMFRPPCVVPTFSSRSGGGPGWN